jgi:hypothetical protein
MDEWAALDREATEWDAMERGGADIEVWVQYLHAVLCIQFSGSGYIQASDQGFFWQKVE